eukprot:scaffold315558_cov26-Tisochrysis_lutea.AAC.4
MFTHPSPSLQPFSTSASPFRPHSKAQHSAAHVLIASRSRGGLQDGAGMLEARLQVRGGGVRHVGSSGATEKDLQPFGVEN